MHYSQHENTINSVVACGRCCIVCNTTGASELVLLVLLTHTVHYYKCIHCVNSPAEEESALLRYRGLWDITSAF